MKLHKNTIKIFGWITIISFLALLFVHYFLIGEEPNSELEFWVNVILGIFGSSLLTFISSIINYRIARRETLQRFNVYVRQILHFLSRYEKSWATDEKIEFFLSYLERDLNSCWVEIMNMDFWLEDYTKSRNYIENYIYNPIYKSEQQILANELQFRAYLERRNRIYNREVAEQGNEKDLEMLGLDKNYEKDLEAHMRYYIFQVEYRLFNKYENPRDQGKLVKGILNELEGRYLQIMYGKKVQRQKEDNK